MTRIEVRPTPKTRKRRRRRRAISLVAYIVVVFGLAWFFESQGTTTIIFVRHADVDQPDVENTDLALNARGRARAEVLARILARADVVDGVDAIYVSPFMQTQQTAEPLAKRLDLEPEIADPYAVVSFMKTVLFEHKREIVLIVSHRDIITPMIEELHGHKQIEEIGVNEYDWMFIVSIPWFGKVKTLQLPVVHDGSGYGTD